jgi:hypothetical protein
MTPPEKDTSYTARDVNRAEAARAMVKYHPDLLESYLQVYDIPVHMEQMLNAVLEQEGKDFRFDTIQEMSVGGDKTPSDVVGNLYGSD